MYTCALYTDIHNTAINHILNMCMESSKLQTIYMYARMCTNAVRQYICTHITLHYVHMYRSDSRPPPPQCQGSVTDSAVSSSDGL